MVDRKTLKVLLSRKHEYAVILECVGDGTIMGDLVMCVAEKGIDKSYGTIVQQVMTLAKYGALKVVRVGKYTVITKNDK